MLDFGENWRVGLSALFLALSFQAWHIVQETFLLRHVFNASKFRNNYFILSSKAAWKTYILYLAPASEWINHHRDRWFENLPGFLLHSDFLCSFLQAFLILWGDDGLHVWSRTGTCETIGGVRSSCCHLSLIWLNFLWVLTSGFTNLDVHFEVLQAELWQWTDITALSVFWWALCLVIHLWGGPAETTILRTWGAEWPWEGQGSRVIHYGHPESQTEVPRPNVWSDLETNLNHVGQE